MSTKGARSRRRVAGAVLATVLCTVAAPAAGAQEAPSNPGTTGVPRKPHLTTPLLSARRVPNLLRSTVADEKLAAAVDALTEKAPPDRCIVVTAHGRPILRVNGDEPLEPASTNKLLTATGIFHNFEPTDTIVTSARAQAAPIGGVVKGDLYLVGGGDALLTTGGYRPTLEDKEQTTVEFGQLADKLKAAGVTSIEGNVVGDESRFDTVRYVETWPTRFQRENTVGPMGALMVNDGVTGYSTSPEQPNRVYKPGDPASLAAETLRTMLTDRGISVGGTAAAGTAPAGTVEVAQLATTYQDEVGEMLAWSDNTTAESLTKILASKAGGTGTTAAGLQATIAALNELGLPTAGLIMRDGSGLDDGNRLTCDLLNALLDAQGPDSALAQGLSIAGQKGTLRKRLRGTPAAGQVFAKTGTLNNPPVASLAGFVKTRQGDTVTFSFVQNGPKSDAGLLDQLALTLYDYPDAPDLTDLQPKPPAP